MEAKHTPGPWKVAGRFIITNEEPGIRPSIIAVWHRYYKKTEEQNNREIETAVANANLIAAAPELLEALIELNRRAFVKFNSEDPRDIEAYNDSNKAISLALHGRKEEK
jgi:hypothetical protein